MPEPDDHALEPELGVRVPRELLVALDPTVERKREQNDSPFFEKFSTIRENIREEEISTESADTFLTAYREN